MMDEPEDVEETLRRLQRELLQEAEASSSNSVSSGGGDGGGGDDDQFKPSYCYGCARTAGVAVCRKPLPKEERRNRGPASALNLKSTGRRRKPLNTRSVPPVKSAANLQVSAKIKKKAVNRLLGQRSAAAAAVTVANHSSARPSTGRQRSRSSGKRGIFPCDKCGRTFTFVYNLKRHIRRRSCAFTLRQYPCPECGENFPTKKSLLPHLKTHREAGATPVFPYECGECGRGLISRRAYQRHLKRHAASPVSAAASAAASSDDRDRPYACGQCDKTFSRLMYLTQHRKTHDMSRPHGCDVCGRAFKSKYQLACHEDTHREARPFPCQICDMAFTRDSYRKVHQRVHTKSIHS